MHDVVEVDVAAGRAGAYDGDAQRRGDGAVKGIHWGRRTWDDVTAAPADQRQRAGGEGVLEIARRRSVKEDAPSDDVFRSRVHREAQRIIIVERVVVLAGLVGALGYQRPGVSCGHDERRPDGGVADSGASGEDLLRAKSCLGAGCNVGRVRWRINSRDFPRRSSVAALGCQDFADRRGREGEIIPGWRAVAEDQVARGARAGRGVTMSGAEQVVRPATCSEWAGRSTG